MEKTLIILKPDCMERRLCGTVLARFEAAGFDIQASKMTRLTSAQLREHYAHVADKPFYPEIEAFMSSRPVIVAVPGTEPPARSSETATGPDELTRSGRLPISINSAGDATNDAPGDSV